MSDKNTPSSLEIAKLNFEEIQKFAQDEAAKALNEQVAQTLQELFEKNLNEDITINIDNDNNVEITKDGESISTGEPEMGLGNPSDLETSMGMNDMDDMDDMETTMGDSDDSEEFVVSDEDDEISLDDTMEETIHNQNMEEMNKMTMEDAAPAPAPEMAPAPDAAAAPVDAAPAAGVTPVEEAPAMPDLLSKLDTLINIMMQQQGGATAEAPGAEAGTEQEFDVIDDESGAPAGAPAPAAAPAQEMPAMEEEFEIEDFEGDHTSFIDEMEEQMLEIVDEDEAPMDGNSVKETRSLGFTSKRTGDKTLKMGAMQDAKGHHAPVTSIKESKNKKAQDESNVDGLVKENKSLKNEIKSLQATRKEFEDAFVELKTQFNEMQLFNGKLALVNKVLMNGGLTVEEKIKICEQFDSAQTHEEATKLYKNIIKENNIKIGDDATKLKGIPTNTAKPKSTSVALYESDEAKRLKKLAGITKTESED